MGHPHGVKSDKWETLPRLIAWEVTRSCMLNCMHCRAAARLGPYEGELDTGEIKRVMDDIASFAKPIIILNHLLSQPNHPATKALEELGKIERSLYLLRYGTDPELRRFVVRHTSHREHWNKFTRNVQAFGDLIQEKTIADQEEVFWFLTVVQNAIILWNALSLERIIPDFQMLSEEDLKRILPTMTGHINFIGRFDLDFNRRAPFKLSQLIE